MASRGRGTLVSQKDFLLDGLFAPPVPVVGCDLTDRCIAKEMQTQKIMILHFWPLRSVASW